MSKRRLETDPSGVDTSDGDREPASPRTTASSTQASPARGRFRSRLSIVLFFCSIVVLSVLYGIIAAQFRLFPYPQVMLAWQGFRELPGLVRPWYIVEADTNRPHPTGHVPPGDRSLNLVTRISGPRSMSAEIVDMHGRVVHQYNIDWFDLWPDAHASILPPPAEDPPRHAHPRRRRAEQRRLGVQFRAPGSDADRPAERGRLAASLSDPPFRDARREGPPVGLWAD